jgi:hypothetical protein
MKFDIVMLVAFAAILSPVLSESTFEQKRESKLNALLDKLINKRNTEEVPMRAMFRRDADFMAKLSALKRDLEEDVPMRRMFRKETEDIPMRMMFNRAVESEDARLARELMADDKPDFAKFWAMGGKRSVNAKMVCKRAIDLCGAIEKKELKGHAVGEEKH